MNIIQVIALCLAICNLIGIYVMYKNSQKQKKNTEILIQINSLQLQMLKLQNEAAISNLWKIRQEIYNWQCAWASQEEYEAAGAAKKMLQNIEYLINALEKTNEDN